MVIGLFGHVPWACTTAGAASARPEAFSTERRVVVILFIGLALAVALACEILIGIGAWSAGGLKISQRIAPINGTVPNIQAMGQLLYTRYLFVFEAAGFVLLVAMIGAIVLTHRQRGGVRGQNIARQNARRPQDATRNTQPTVGQGVQL